MNIRRRGNIITNEKTVKVADTETISQDTFESLRNELDNCRDDLSATYKAAQPTKRGIYYLGYRTETTKKFIEVVNDKYASCLKNKSISKVLQKLQYTIKLAKVKEVEENVQDDNDDPEVTIKGSSKRKSFQESLPHSRVTGNTRPDVKRTQGKSTWCKNLISTS